MKIILSAKSVYPFHPVGGVQKYVYNYAKYLKGEGVDVEIVAPLDKGKPRQETFDGIKYTFLKPAIYWYLEYPIGWLGVHLFSCALANYLKTIEFDILHSFDMTAYQYLKLKNRKKVIVHPFTDNFLSNPISMNNPLNILNLTASKYDPIKEKKIMISPYADAKTKTRYWAQYYFKIRPMDICLKNADYIFFEDIVTNDEIVRSYQLNSDKAKIIPVGVDLAFISDHAKQPVKRRSDIGIDQEDIVLITVNRLAADKGIDKIILSLEQIIKENRKVKLIMIGSGYQEKELYALIKQKGLDPFVRHFKDVPENELYSYYQLSNIYISAFSYYGSSISTLEAMACSLPVITTAQPWLIQENKNGIVLKDNDPELIKEAVLALINKGNLPQMGEVSKDVVKTYDWRYIARIALQKYENLMSYESSENN